MSMMLALGIVAGIVIALVVLCVVIAAMFPPKEYKGDIVAAGRTCNDYIENKEVHV